MLALVVADRDPGRPVEQDVRGHQHRVGVQRHAGPRAAPALLLELDHPVQLAGVAGALEQVGQLGVRRDAALHEQRGPLRVEPGGEQERRRLAGERAQGRRVVRHGQGVQVGDPEEAGGVLLLGRHRSQGAEVVAEGQVAGRLEQAQPPVAVRRGARTGQGRAPEGRGGGHAWVLSGDEPEGAAAETTTAALGRPLSMCSREASRGGPPSRRATTRSRAASACAAGYSPGPCGAG